MKVRTKLTALVLTAFMVVMPMRAGDRTPPPPQTDNWIAICVVVAAGMAVGAVYLLNKRCQPRYYWLMSDDQPPTFWVGTATDRQCKIEGWTKIGGPYNRPQDAPAVHPNPTNRVTEVAGPVLHHSVERSTDGVTWTTIHEENSTQEDFGYFVPMGSECALFRIGVRAP